MSLVRQLPEIYLRGSLANETMKNLTKEQLANVEEIYRKIVSHPELNGHRSKVMEKFGATIGCDYRDDNQYALQDFNIAIWRATVHLLYHSDYEYHCTACNSNKYNSKQRGKSIKFDRRYQICPNCECVSIKTPGDSTLEVGSHINHSMLLILIEKLEHEDKEPPTTESCVVSTPGKSKIENPQAIINDPDQLRKFFGFFVWNYFRQVLKENKITTHGKKVQQVRGPADELTTDVILSILKEFNVEHHYDRAENPRSGVFKILCNPHGAPLEFTIRLCKVIETAVHSGVIITVDHTKITISHLGADSPLVTQELFINETAMVSNKQVKSDTNGFSDIDIINQQPASLDIEYSVEGVEQSERLKILRESLSDGDCKKVFDLYTASEPLFSEFLASSDRAVQTANGVPRQNKIARFLKTTPKEINRHKQEITIQCLRYGLCPIS